MKTFTPKNRQKFLGSAPANEDSPEMPGEEMIEESSEVMTPTDPMPSSDGMEAVKQMIGGLAPEQLKLLNEYTAQLLAENNTSAELDVDKMMNDDMDTSAAEDSSATVNGQNL